VMCGFIDAHREWLTVIRNRLKRIQYRPDLYAGFLAHAGLPLPAEPP